ncbi:MAG TPA: DUF2892 domain-containing protein [Ktedonobacterales bacterium]|nr:DUF2892 domain-containing protein [Ktedonobacterales bacterium]
MGAFVGFMQSIAGRMLRIVVGLVLIGAGWIVVQGTGGTVLAVIGLVPLIAGVVGICLLAPLFGYTLRGVRRVRHAS